VLCSCCDSAAFKPARRPGVLQQRINRDVPCCTVLMSFSESYTAMYSNVPCMVYKHPFSYIKVYTFFSLYIEVHRCIHFRGKVYTCIYLDIPFRSYLYHHSIVQVLLKSYNQVYQSIYLDIPHLVQVVEIPDGRRPGSRAAPPPGRRQVTKSLIWNLALHDIIS
jgi:hypothetical protein